MQEKLSPEEECRQLGHVFAEQVGGDVGCVRCQRVWINDNPLDLLEALKRHLKLFKREQLSSKYMKSELT